MTVLLCHLRVFRLPRFPRACLRQSMALYRVLTRRGYPVEIHFGIHKDRDVLQGHSWVTLDGRSIADGTQTEAFKRVYSYPANSIRISGGWRVGLDCTATQTWHRPPYLRRYAT
jgi:hypothetical protein